MIRLAMFYLLIFCPLSLFSAAISAKPVTLKNDKWKIVLSTDTLSIQAGLINQPLQAVNQSTHKHIDDIKKLTQTQLSLSWDHQHYLIDARLHDNELQLDISSSSPSTLPLIQQSEQSLGSALILPLAEGHFIPVNQPQWKTFLLQKNSQFNTTQDLSLPLWGNVYPQFIAHWILINPYNNQINFSKNKNANLNLSLKHTFISQNPIQKFSLILYLDQSKSPISGAKRYRQLLIEQDHFQTLAQKMTATPSINKLIGAQQVYFWGNDLLGEKDVKNWPILIETLNQPTPFIKQLTDLFESDAKQLLKSHVKMPFPYQKTLLINNINQAINDIAHIAWEQDEPNYSQIFTIYSSLRKKVKMTFGKALTNDDDNWGDILTLDTIRQLKKANINRLWIGLADGFEGGLWHPNVIQKAVDSGYMIAPYDSYETALGASGNRDWSTAHLGNKAYHQCVIIQKNKTIKSGFKQSGHYTDAKCITPWLKERISQLHQSVPFNSWFLDAYASGMLFDNYATNPPLTQADNANAIAQNIHWVTQTFGLPVGSEDGNAVTATNIVFAQGMQTPVIGWGDPDLTNPDSKYFLGKWYPNNQPSLFFKQTSIKEPYKTIYFDPSFRLPLYQTVFHDAIITTHHWLFDSFKLNNVKTENILMQQFYNVPGLYNLSSKTLQQRLKEMVNINAFFASVHKTLAFQSIKEFQWLTADRRVQKLIFSDNSMLIVNTQEKTFENKQVKISANCVEAWLANGKQFKYCAK